MDGLLARWWAKVFPELVHLKIAPHSLRKMTIQMLYDLLKMLGKFSDSDIGEFVGWMSVKKTVGVRCHYADLSMAEYCRMLAQADPDALPWEIATVSRGPPDPAICMEGVGGQGPWRSGYR